MHLFSALRRTPITLLFLAAACGGTGTEQDSTGDQLEAECNLACEPGYHCELEEVTCVRAPCPPVELCVEDQPPSCDDVSCDPGYRCELQEVVCVRAPCPPIPVCVEEAEICGDATCAPGEHCELQEVQCFAAPCPPIPTCTP